MWWVPILAQAVRIHWLDGLLDSQTGQQHLGGQQQHGHAPGDSTLNGGGGGGAGGNNSALETPLTRGTYPVVRSRLLLSCCLVLLCTMPPLLPLLVARSAAAWLQAGSAGVSQLPDGVGGGGSGAASGIASVAHGPGGSGSASPPGGAQGGGSGVAMSSLGPRYACGCLALSLCSH